LWDAYENEASYGEVLGDKNANIKIAIPLQTWTYPEGSRRLRLPDFKTFGTLRW